MNEEMSIAGQIAILAIQLGVILFAARFCGNLARKIHVPSVLGELIAGIIIGPYLLGSMGIGIHGFEHGLFPLISGSSLPVSTPLYGIATLGSIVLLFMSGLETDLRMFFRYSVAGTVIGLGGVIFSFAFGAGLGMIMLDTGMMDPRALFLGILCTATSVGITARILSEKKSIDSPEGTTILAAAVIDDVLGIICLAVVMGIVGMPTDGGGGVDWTRIEIIAVKSVGIWLGVTAVGLIFAHRIAQFLKCFRPSAVFSILALGLALLLAGLFEQAGLAMIVGAYVMGLCLSKTDISFSIQRSLRGVYDFLVPVFFVVMGMLVDVRVLGDSEVLTFGLIYSALAVLAKIIGCAIPALFMNFNMLGSLRIGAGMIPRGEVALIIAGIGATTMMKVNGTEVPVIDSKLFGVAIIMTLLTTIVAPPLLALMLAKKGKGIRKDVNSTAGVHIKYSFPNETVRDFILREFIDNLRSEGFRHSEIDREGGITHLRREEKTFTLQMQKGEMDFDVAANDVPLIKTAMYETIVELHKILGGLKELSIHEINSIASAPPIQATKSTEPLDKKPLNIGKIIPLECIITDLSAKSHSEAVHELLEHLNRGKYLKDFNKCEADLLERESIVSTCIGNGVALPHARTAGTEKLVAAIGISKNGYMEFGHFGQSVNVTILSVCPRNTEEPYLQFISRIASKLSDENIRQTLKCADAPAIMDALSK